MGGLGLGSLVAVLFAQYLGAPTRLVFVAFLIIVVAVTLLTFLVRETNPRQCDRKIGVAAQLAFRSRAPPWLILWGLALLIVSLGLVLAGFLTEIISIFAVGTVIGGFGAGLGFLGGLGQLSCAVPHESHAESIESYFIAFIAAQAGLAVPVLAVGALTGPFGLTGATSTLIDVVVLLAAGALALNAKRTHKPRMAVPPNFPATCEAAMISLSEASR